MDGVQGRCKIGRTGKAMDAAVMISPRRSAMTIQIDRRAERGESITVSFDWPQAIAFAAAVCAKAAEMAKLAARSE
jgi:hypothetical protein